MRVALSSKVKHSRLSVVDSLNWKSVKTKILANRIEELGWTASSSLLLVSGLTQVPLTLLRASSNLNKIELKTASEVTIHDLLRFSRVVLDIPAVEYFEKTLSKWSTLPEPDSRPPKLGRRAKSRRREDRRVAAAAKAEVLSEQIVELQYRAKSGQFGLREGRIPPISRRLSREA